MAKLNKILFIISCLLSLYALYITTIISLSVPKYTQLFSGFGAKLPPETINALNYHYIGLLLPITALLLCAYYFKRSKTQVSKNVVYTLITVSFLVTLYWSSFFVEAMYLPIFQMGDVINGL